MPKRDPGRNAGARANALPLRLIASHLGEALFGFFKRLCDSGRSGSARDRMIFERLPRRKKAHRFCIEFRGHVAELLRGPVLRLLAGANALEHQRPDDLMGTMKRHSAARQNLGEFGSAGPAFVGRRFPSPRR